MATSDVPVFEVSLNPPPRPFAVAAWLGMSSEEIMSGLEDGSIAPPPGAPVDWMPPGAHSPGRGSVLALPSSSNGDTAPAAGNGSEISDAVATSTGGPIDRARVFGWFRGLDASLTDAAFDAIWQHAGESDAARAAQLTGFLARTLLGANPAGPTNPGPTTAADVGIALGAFTADPSHHAQVVDLSGMSGTELARRAQTDVGIRYALTQFDSVALTGNRALFATANADGHLDRFDPDTGENDLSDAWLADRGKFLAWKLAGDAGKRLAIEGDQAWTFVDRARLDANGQPLTVQLSTGTRDATRNQVVFGAESAEQIKGGAGTDRIYGGGGDDVLRGAAGADHLEGGRGDDLALGGSGNDELAGNQGNDELDGGRGTDSLDGGRGDDTLTGGRGDDQLAGGLGVDAYVFDAGDGTDTITDSDGQGRIELDDAPITGAIANADGRWTSADGRLDFSVDGDLTGESTLTVRAFADGADHAGESDNLIQVRHWHNGELGITLGAIGGPGSQSTVAQDTSAQVVADNFLTDINGGEASGSDADSTATGVEPAADTADSADTSGQGVATGDTPAPAAEPPEVDVASSAQPFDAADALSQLLAPPAGPAPAVDPSQLHRAIAAFSGVLAPPDIAPSETSGGASLAGTVTLADVSSALAGDFGSDDLGHEASAGLAHWTPDWHHIEAAALSLGDVGRGRGVGNVTDPR